MLERHCFACGQQWPATCKCVRPDIKWQDLVTRLESDLQVAREALEAMLHDWGGFRTYDGGEAESCKQARLALSRILEGGTGSGAPADAGQALVNQAPAGLGPSGFDPSRGGSDCPICGLDTPHHHSREVVDAYHNKRSRV